MSRPMTARRWESTVSPRCDRTVASISYCFDATRKAAARVLCAHRKAYSMTSSSASCSRALPERAFPSISGVAATKAAEMGGSTATSGDGSSEGRSRMRTGLPFAIWDFREITLHSPVHGEFANPRKTDRAAGKRAVTEFRRLLAACRPRRFLRCIRDSHTPSGLAAPRCACSNGRSSYPITFVAKSRAPDSASPGARGALIVNLGRVSSAPERGKHVRNPHGLSIIGIHEACPDKPVATDHESCRDREHQELTERSEGPDGLAARWPADVAVRQTGRSARRDGRSPAPAH